MHRLHLVATFSLSIKADFLRGSLLYHLVFFWPKLLVSCLSEPPPFSTQSVSLSSVVLSMGLGSGHDEDILTVMGYNNNCKFSIKWIIDILYIFYMETFQLHLCTFHFFAGNLCVICRDIFFFTWCWSLLFLVFGHESRRLNNYVRVWCSNLMESHPQFLCLGRHHCCHIWICVLLLPWNERPGLLALALGDLWWWREIKTKYSCMFWKPGTITWAITTSAIIYTLKDVICFRVKVR